jgi:hypothetical protein
MVSSYTPSKIREKHIRSILIYRFSPIRVTETQSLMKHVDEAMWKKIFIQSDGNLKG